MKSPQQGNGSGRFEIGVHDMGGWVRVTASQNTSSIAELPYYLADRLSGWFRENPQLRLLCIVPINRDGHTVELHPGTINICVKSLGSRVKSQQTIFFLALDH